MAQIGVNIVEGEAHQSSFVVGAPSATIGLLLESTRGVPNKAVKVTSSSQARRLYGDPMTTKGGVLAMRALFNNASTFGALVYAVRIPGTSAVSALSTLANTGSTEFKARVSGTAGNSYQVTITAGTNVGIKIVLEDDPTTVTVTETFDDINTPALLRECINFGKVGYHDETDGGPSTLMTVSFVGGTVPDTLTKTAITGGATGVYGTAEAPIATPTASVITAGQYGEDDPGAWGNSISFTIAGTSGNEELRDIKVYKTLSSGEIQLVESWTELGPDDWVNKLNNTGSGSEFIKVTTAGDFPDAYSTAQFLLTGAEGTTPVTAGYQGVSASGTGIYAFDEVPVQIISSVDDTTKELAVSMDTYCLANNMIGVMCTPYAASLATLESDWTPILGKQKSNLSVYRGWCSVSDESGGTQWIPNVGHVIGAGYIRKMMTQGGYPHIAPAGNATGFLDCLKLEFAGYNATDLESLVHTVKINAITYKANVGFVIRTSRTFSTLSKYYSVHVRRSINYVIESLDTSLGWVEQASNSQGTRNTLADVLHSFFNELYGSGMFETEGGYSNNVNVKCDLDNNDERIRAERRLVCEITLRFADVAESVEVTLQTTQEGILQASAS